jgi:hypothetical protein
LRSTTALRKIIALKIGNLEILLRFIARIRCVGELETWGGSGFAAA